MDSILRWRYTVIRKERDIVESCLLLVHAFLVKNMFFVYFAIFCIFMLQITYIFLMKYFKYKFMGFTLIKEIKTFYNIHIIIINDTNTFYCIIYTTNNLNIVILTKSINTTANCVNIVIIN